MKIFPAVRLQGGLFAPDLFERLVGEELTGQKPVDFGLKPQARLTEEIAAAFADAESYWRSFRRRLDRVAPDDPATSLTRDAWVIPFLSLLGYNLTFVRKAPEISGISFPISHRAGESEEAPPVHIVGFRQPLDRASPTGRPRLAPHSLLQEFLNRSEALWGIVTNGRVLRLLRDSTYVRQQCFLEFDLEAIFEQRLFEDFSVLYRLLHRSRLPKPGEDPERCLLERYYQDSLEQGGRVRDRLRDGVEKAITLLANGFLRHRDNTKLRQLVTAKPSAADRLSPQELYTQLLRLIYRFLFLLVCEDRNLVTGSALYREHYSVSRFRRLVDRRSAYTDDADLWHSLQALWKILTDSRPICDGQPPASLLGLTVLDGALFEPLFLDQCLITNRDLLEALWYLINYQDSPTSPPRRVNYAALDVEELGSVYESLLDFQPSINTAQEPPQFELVSGSERKSTGSYYTPAELVHELVKSALEPVLKSHLQQAEHLANQLKRVASSEWRVVKLHVRKLWGDKHGDSLLSRLGSLAKGYGSRREHLSSVSAAAEGRTLRPDDADASGSGLSARQYSRGLGTPPDQGVPPVPERSSGQPQGIGDVHYPGPTGPTDFGPNRPYAAYDDRIAQSEVSQLASQVEGEIGEAWERLPLATRHSLLAKACAEHAVLSLRVIDPACGSGHFLLAAARRLGKELARLRTGEDEPAPEALREAIRDCIAHCIYGVDKNPLAVELCKVALWIEGHTPGKPLSFLDHRIRCGDSLVGLFDLEVLKQGIPDDAFDPVTDHDDKKLASALKKKNREERRGQLTLAFHHVPEDPLASYAQAARQIDAIPDDTVEAINQKAKQYGELRQRQERLRQAADLWTAAFFQEFVPREAAITTAALRQVLAGQSVDPQVAARAQALATRLRFFHWPLEFPEVFADGGFDVVLCNPPWEIIELDEQEFFAPRDPSIASAANKAEREARIKELQKKNLALWQEYINALHDVNATRKFLRESGRCALTATGRINSYSVFSELFLRLLNRTGRAGAVVPTGIATDATNQQFFQHLIDSRRLLELFGFDNSFYFRSVGLNQRLFSLLTIGPPTPSAITFGFWLSRVSDRQDARRVFTLQPSDIVLLNPNTRTCPIFRTRQDAELTKAIYRRVPVLVNEQAGDNPWGVSFKQGLFNMASDSRLFRTGSQLLRAGYRLVGNRFVKGKEVWLPLYEAKMIWHFDHRFGTFEGATSRSDTHLPAATEADHADPHFLVQPWYWVSAQEVRSRLENWPRHWLLGWRDVTNATNERTVIASVLPYAPAGNTLPLVQFSINISPKSATCFVGDQCSLVHDFSARMKIGGTHLVFSVVKQLPHLPSRAFGAEEIKFISPRVLELVYTSWDIKPFADDVWREASDELRQAIRRQWEENAAETGGHRWVLPPWIDAYPEIETDRHKGIPLPPFKWSEDRRARLRAQLDAYYAHLYGLTRKQLRYILDPADLTPRELADILDPTEEVTDPLDPAGYEARCRASDFPGETFRVLKEKEIKQFGEYRTRRLVLEAWRELFGE